jgi:DNA-directed RNA polymerase specialized sigma24 family protein
MMKNGLSDEEIIAGLQDKDSEITRTYFYGYCRIGYYVLSRRYGLSDKFGMDFYSLAHEYYLALDKNDWRQLSDRKPDMSLRTWMINGFRFLVLDRLKEVEKEKRFDSFEERVENTHLKFDIIDSDFNADVRKTLEEVGDRYYGRDSKASLIVKMMLVEGFKGKEVAAQLGMTPSAVTQRYHQMMERVIIPYFKANFETIGDIIPDNCEVSMDYSPLRETIQSAKTMETNYQNRTTPSHIDHLADNEIFVFGSNLAGMHGGGAARAARLYFGAVMGQGVGLQGQSYAIPTMQGGTETIRPYVDDFIAFARQHPEKKFLVTRIGCGIAGFDAEDIAPLFGEAENVKNICLPDDFWNVLKSF